MSEETPNEFASGVSVALRRNSESYFRKVRTTTGLFMLPNLSFGLLNPRCWDGAASTLSNQ